MESTRHRLFKIPDGENVIVYVPTLRKVYRVGADIAERLPNFVIAPNPGVQQDSGERTYLFTSATLLLTNQCKLGCIYCFGGYVPRPAKTIVMPVEVAYATVNYLVESAGRLGNHQIGAWMFGGEPTLPWDTLIEATQYLRLQASEHGLESSAGITTNGCVAPPKARWLADNMDHILLSMDGPEDIHNAQRGGSFNRVFGTAREIYRISPRKLKFRSTVSAVSVHRLTETVRFFGESFPGCTQAYEPLFAMGRAKANPLAQPPDDSLFFEKFMEAVEVAKTLGIRIQTSMTEAWRKTGTSFCDVAEGNFTVTYDGRVVSCHRMVEDGVNNATQLFCYGRYDPLGKGFVFDETQYRNLKRLTVTSIPECRDCFAQYSCRGDCPANKAEVSPDSFWKERRYRCKEIQEFSKNLLKYVLDHEGEDGLIF